jgi:hypothetical protein
VHAPSNAANNSTEYHRSTHIMVPQCRTLRRLQQLSLPSVPNPVCNLR